MDNAKQYAYLKVILDKHIFGTKQTEERKEGK